MINIFLYYHSKYQLMKSIANIKKTTVITISIFITASLIAATPAIMSIDVYADHPSDLRDTRFEAPSVMSQDSSSGFLYLQPPLSTVTPPSPESVTPMPSFAQPFPTPQHHYSCAAKVISDSPEGNALGWNPNGTDTIFTISEPCYFEDDSTVIVNIKDGGSNYEVCNVDFSDNQFFEVYCNAPPDEGSQLRYMVIVQDLEVIGGQPIPLEELPEEIAERKQNATQ
jgi:hypothetical protein